MVTSTLDDQQPWSSIFTFSSRLIIQSGRLASLVLRLHSSSSFTGRVLASVRLFSLNRQLQRSSSSITASSLTIPSEWSASPILRLSQTSSFIVPYWISRDNPVWIASFTGPTASTIVQPHSPAQPLPPDWSYRPSGQIHRSGIGFRLITPSEWPASTIVLPHRSSSITVVYCLPLHDSS
ncbi:hypothetical protein N7467_002631 [Penicillium canescens]|nr:hypothetical protein N7467_002631 [Penicillium canescens]